LLNSGLPNPENEGAEALKLPNPGDDEPPVPPDIENLGADETEVAGVGVGTGGGT